MEKVEHQIVFSGPMVQAILEGRKLQTRLVVKYQPPSVAVTAKPKIYVDRRTTAIWAVNALPSGSGVDADCYCSCPYGKTGDRLWVREEWGRCVGGFCYRASEYPDFVPDDGKWRWAGSMPRIASRIDLEITEIRVERLNEIDWWDAVKEGMEDPHDRDKRIDPISGTVAKYRESWESIHGPGSWKANPFVWVIEFKRVDTTS